VGAQWLEKAKIDDPVSAVPVHLFNGIWGTLALGLFATDTGLFYTGSAGQLFAQLVGVLAYGAWCLATGLLMFWGIKATVGLRVPTEEELAGLDKLEHGTVAYPADWEPSPEAVHEALKGKAPAGLPVGASD
jgi:Amt family ammonium transporter